MEPKKRGRKKSDPVTVSINCAICGKSFERTYPRPSNAKYSAPATCGRKCARLLGSMTALRQFMASS